MWCLIFETDIAAVGTVMSIGRSGVNSIQSANLTNTRIITSKRCTSKDNIVKLYLYSLGPGSDPNPLGQTCCTWIKKMFLDFGLVKVNESVILFF